MSAKNSEKLTLLLVRKMFALAQPPCLCGHTIYFKKYEVFCSKKCGHPHLKTSLVRKKSVLDKTLPPNCGRLLWTTP